MSKSDETRMVMEAGSGQADAGDARARRMGEMMEIIAAYNTVTDRLEKSHAQLNEEVARLRGELASANAALQRSRRLAALGEMAAGIAHEIRNPLGSIQLYAGLLVKDLKEEAGKRELAEKIVDAVRGLDGIVGDVLTFAREMRVRWGEVEVEDLMAQSATAAGVVEGGGVRLLLEVEEGLAMKGDRDLLRGAIVNLVRNAVEAMEGRGLLVMRAGREGGAVWMEVRDSGGGIGEEAIDRIFNPFFTTRATGTGLGLAIVHRIVDAHGGMISVHNDGGAVFTMRFAEEGRAKEMELVVDVKGGLNGMKKRRGRRVMTGGRE